MKADKELVIFAGAVVAKTVVKLYVIVAGNPAVEDETGGRWMQ